jgi:hypothetical protein
MIVQRGFRQPPSFHEERLVTAPPGHFFDVMTNGFGAMPDYTAQVPVPDRWAIASYIKALQFSRRATLADVPADRTGQLESAPPAPAPRGQTPSAPPGTQPGAAGAATAPGAAPTPAPAAAGQPN